MRLTYYKSFIKNNLDKLIESYKSCDRIGKRQIKEYIYGNVKLTTNEKDRIWKEIIGY